MKRSTIIFFLLFVSGGTLAGQTLKYAVTDLGPLSERTPLSAVRHINDAGTAAATIPATDPNVRAARWSSFLGFEDLAADSSTGSSVARSINYAGDIAGWTVDANGAETAAVWRAQQMTLLALPGTASHAKDINDSGQVVGDYVTAAGTRAFLWDPVAGALELGMLPGSTSCYATAINRYEDVVGYCVNPAATFPLKAFIWSRQAGMRAVLPKFSGSTVALGVNDLRQVVGYVQDKTSSSAFICDMASSRTVYMPAPRTRSGSQYSVAHGVNEAGTAAGEANARAYLYLQGKQYDLNSLIPGDSGWTLVAAYHLNAAGQIVGVGNLNGRRRGFMLTPVR